MYAYEHIRNVKRPVSEQCPHSNVVAHAYVERVNPRIRPCNWKNDFARHQNLIHWLRPDVPIMVTVAWILVPKM